MSGETLAAQLVLLLTAEYGDEAWGELGSLRRIEEGILTSDWLAAHDAAVRAEHGERIAQAIEAQEFATGLNWKARDAFAVAKNIARETGRNDG